MFENIELIKDALQAVLMIGGTLATIATTIYATISSQVKRGQFDLDKNLEAFDAIKEELVALIATGALKTVGDVVKKGLEMIQGHRDKELEPKMIGKASSRLRSLAYRHGLPSGAQVVDKD